MQQGGCSQALPIPLMPGMAPSHSMAMVNPAFAQGIPTLQRSGTSSASSCPDPFTEPAAYREWLNSLGLGQFHLPPGRCGRPVVNLRTHGQQALEHRHKHARLRLVE